MVTHKIVIKRVNNHVVETRLNVSMLNTG